MQDVVPMLDESVCSLYVFLTFSGDEETPAGSVACRVLRRKREDLERAKAQEELDSYSYVISHSLSLSLSLTHTHSFTPLHYAI